MCGRFELRTKFNKLPKVLKKDCPIGLNYKYETQIIITCRYKLWLKIEILI